ncbi:MAG: isoaspartyl peptidase/L-asparaginase [Bacteroidia bacterium]
MSRIILILFFISMTGISYVDAQAKKNLMKHSIAIAVHGGAGNLKKLGLTPEQEKNYRDTLALALHTGYEILKKGGSSVDAVQAAINVLEDSPLFNAGKGSVFTNDSINEMDAAIMNGADLKCGAVAGVRTIKNPINAARVIMDSSQFVFLSGRGAEKFAAEQHLEIVDPSYFYTKSRWDQLQKLIHTDTVALDHDSTTGDITPMKDEKFGTVGCVAIDEHGNLAAGTSTGGLANKKYNRIGDSPLIGAGTYANNKTCAVSCTGKGEDFIRLVVAYDISALMQYRNITLKDAATYVIMQKLKKAGGRGGCIAIDKYGHIQMPYTTDGMFRGYIDTKGKMNVMIWEK